MQMDIRIGLHSMGTSAHTHARTLDRVWTKRIEKFIRNKDDPIECLSGSKINFELINYTNKLAAQLDLHVWCVWWMRRGREFSALLLKLFGNGDGRAKAEKKNPKDLELE